MTRVWNPVRNHCAPTWWCYKRKEPPGAGCPAQTAPWGDLPLEITQVGRLLAGSARSRAGGSRRRLHARIAGTPTKPWGFAAMPSSGCVRRTRCLLGFVVLAGISLTHPAQASERICATNYSRCYSPHSDVRRSTLVPGTRENVAGPRRSGEDPLPDAGSQTSQTPDPIPGSPRRRPAGTTQPRWTTTLSHHRTSARPPDSPRITPVRLSDSESTPPSRYTLASAPRHPPP